VKSNNVRGVVAIKVSGCVPERFFFARRFCPPQVVTGNELSLSIPDLTSVHISILRELAKYDQSRVYFILVTVWVWVLE
jgi:hypothetical protein